MAKAIEDPPETANAGSAVRNRITEVRKARGFTLEQLADLTGLSVGYISRMANRGRNVSLQNLGKLASAMGVDPRELLSSGGDDDVPVVGYVGAGAMAHYYDIAHSPNDFVPIPAGIPLKSIADLVAVEVRGDSLGSILNGWLVFYNDLKMPPDPTILKKLCVVGLPDGRILVKMVMKGPTPGRFNLVSNTEGTIEDAEIEWAAEVRAMAPR